MMSGGQFARDDRQPYEQQSEQEPREPHVPDPALLEKVLEETLSSGGSAESAEELEALAKVARRHHGSALADPIIAELVEAVLRVRFRDLTLTQQSWRSMSDDIATTLSEDPELRQRLERFWTQLTEFAK